MLTISQLHTEFGNTSDPNKILSVFSTYICFFITFLYAGQLRLEDIKHSTPQPHGKKNIAKSQIIDNPLRC